MNSIKALTEFDADPNVLVIIAHDTAPLEQIQPQDWFPKGTINDWQKKGWKESMHWHFLNELPVEGKTGRDVIVDGLYKDGKKIKNLEGKEA